MKVGDIRITKQDICYMYPDSLVKILQIKTDEDSTVIYEYIEGSLAGRYSQPIKRVEQESVPLSKLHKYLLSEEENHAS
jgi:hypothetical protein